MNKIYFLGSLAVLTALASCSKDEYNYEQSYTVGALNIITDISNNETIVSDGSYQFTLKVSDSNQSGVVSSSNIIINNNTYGFESVEQPYKSYGYDAYFQNVQSTTGNLTSANFVLTPFFYTPAQFNINYSYTLPMHVVIGQYVLSNQYVVKTFQKNTFFVGKTTTSYPGAGGAVSTSTKDNIYYLLTIDTAKTPNTASIKMFNAKFSDSEREPLKAQINIDGLAVDYSNGMIKVTGENIVPDMVEGSAATPNPDFIINKIEFITTTGDLVHCSINYVVAGVYNGSFTGAYAVPYYDAQR